MAVHEIPFDDDGGNLAPADVRVENINPRRAVVHDLAPQNLAQQSVSVVIGRPSDRAGTFEA